MKVVGYIFVLVNYVLEFVILIVFFVIVIVSVNYGSFWLLDSLVDEDGE